MIDFYRLFRYHTLRKNIIGEQRKLLCEVSTDSTLWEEAFNNACHSKAFAKTRANEIAPERLLRIDFTMQEADPYITFRTLCCFRRLLAEVIDIKAQRYAQNVQKSVYLARSMMDSLSSGLLLKDCNSLDDPIVRRIRSDLLPGISFTHDGEPESVITLAMVIRCVYSMLGEANGKASRLCEEQPTLAYDDALTKVIGEERSKAKVIVEHPDDFFKECGISSSMVESTPAVYEKRGWNSGE